MVTSIKVEEDEDHLLAEDPLQMLDYGDLFDSWDDAFVSNIVEALDGQEARDMAVLSQPEDIRTAQRSCGSKKLDQCAEESHFRRDNCSTTCLKGHLTTDLQKRTEEQPFKCKECGKSFAWKYFLAQHIKLHIGERPFRCTECSYSFKGKWKLSQHMVVAHKGKWPFRCNKCRKPFLQRAHLALHIRAHTQERPFKCNECHKAFAYQWRLTSHMRWHTEERSLRCRKCNRWFTVKHAFLRHLQTHTRKYPLKSQKCDHTQGEADLINTESQRGGASER